MTVHYVCVRCSLKYEEAFRPVPFAHLVGVCPRCTASNKAVEPAPIPVDLAVAA